MRGGPSQDRPALVCRDVLQRVHFFRLRALRAAPSGVLDPLVLLKGTETVDLDGGVVDEDVGRAVVRGDETIALVRVEPLHGALRHVLLLLRRFREPRSCAPGCCDHCPCGLPWRAGRFGTADARGQNFAGAVTRTRTSCNQNYLTTHGYWRVPNRGKCLHRTIPATSAAPSRRSLMQVANAEPGVAAAMRSASRTVSTSISSGSRRIRSPARSSRASCRGPVSGRDIGTPSTRSGSILRRPSSQKPPSSAMPKVASAVWYTTGAAARAISARVTR